MTIWWLAGCLEARVAHLEDQVAGLERDIASAERVVAAMKAKLDRARDHVIPVRNDLDPQGFDGERTIPRGDPSRPDVILLSIDTLRADHLGAYGYERDTSPFIDALAREGSRFEDAWSPSPWTLPSHTTMLSGYTPLRHGSIEDDLPISANVPLIQEKFRDAGYATVGAVATLFVSSRYGFDRGFDHFVDFGVHSTKLNNLSTVDADHVFHHALHFLQEAPAGKPVFAFVHVYDAHFAYNAPPPFNEKFDRKAQLGDAIYKNYHDYKKSMIDDEQLAHQVAQYDEEIAFVDAKFRELVETWRASGREVIVVLSADHGEEFGERGSWGHGHTLWREQLHVPLIVNGPGIRTQVVKGRVGTEDIAPTIAGLVGLESWPSDGVDRTQTLKTGAPVPSRAARLAETSRFDTIRYRWHEAPWEFQLDAATGARHLCQVVEDPWCQTNRVEAAPDKAAAMEAGLLKAIGDGWKAVADGRVASQDGIPYIDGKRSKGGGDVTAGTAFAVLPLDARVSFNVGGAQRGPWRGIASPFPEATDGLEFLGPRSVAIQQTAAEKELLATLGYMDHDEPEKPAPE